MARWHGECWKMDQPVKCAPTHLKRYKDVALLFYRHARSEIAMNLDRVGMTLRPTFDANASLSESSVTQVSPCSFFSLAIIGSLVLMAKIHFKDD
jgi:hypothetical protein